MEKPALYYAYFSPPARACMLTAKLIGLDLDLKFVDFAQRQHMDEQFLKLNPQHQIPVFIDTDGEVYVDSHSIMIYMVSKYGQSDNLYPNDFGKRARIHHRMHFECGDLFPVIKDVVARNVYGPEGELNPKSIDACHKAYAILEAFLQNSDYMVGDSMTLADISINTTLITLDLLMPVHEDKYPKLNLWMERMKSLPDYEQVNAHGANLLCTRIKAVMEQNKAKAQ